MAVPSRRTRRRALSLAALATAAALLTAPSAGATRGLSLGIADPGSYFADAPTREARLSQTTAAGAGFVVLSVDWSTISRARRSAAQLANPDDPGYDWSGLDGPVRAAAAHGLRIVLSFSRAPAWAEGAHRPRSAAPGTWRPNPSLFGAFVRAAARRYSGAVRYWQIWTEPNLSTHLSPQFVRGAAASPAIYRGLLNAGYDAVKAVRRSNVVLTAGTAPFGGNVLNITRVAPAAFWRSVFCVSARLRPLRCPHPAKFDVLAHDPYSVARPTQRALNGDDVSIPDMGKLIRPLRAAERTHRIRPAGRKAVWVTEFGWDSRPPDPNGVPIQQHARWLEQALYVLWRQGVAMATWFKIVDEPSGGDFGATYQSGLYELDGTAKPALTAFGFPFVTERASRSRVRAWGKAPASGSVSIQRQAGAGWRTLRTLHVSGSRVFLTTLALRGSAVVRAVSGGNASLTWGQR